MQESLLVNTLGHAAGVLIFGIFLFLLLRDRASARLRGSRQSLMAAGLALLWNAASLLVLSGLPDAAVRWVYFVGFASLSLLPAVLLDISLLDRYRMLVRFGYLVSAASIALHAAEVASSAVDYHRLGLQLTTAGFAALSLLAAAGVLWSGDHRRRDLTSRIVGPMALFLLAVSFFHFGDQHMEQAWSRELAFHHAGIPLALLILLQDYRFVLLDAFVRFLANMLLAIGFTLLAAAMFQQAQPLESRVGFEQGMWLVGACLLFVVFALLRIGIQRLLTRLVFRRADPERLANRLRAAGASASGETAFLEIARKEIAHYFSAEPVNPRDSSIPEALAQEPVAQPALASDLPAPLRDSLEREGIQVVVPLSLRPGERTFLFLGRRSGGRRYLSEDLNALGHVASAVRAQMEEFREAELKRLVSQAELRALQSQINPHFLFNALNTLYGIIPREAAGARRTVLNLADLFRYFLRGDRNMLPFEEELQIIEAYLEIERLRLGDKLRVEIDVDPAARSQPIPVLSVEPLVENAIKHGVSRSPQGGLVRLEARIQGEALCISVTDTGAGFGTRPQAAGAGVGLENVARRLELSYGPEATLQIDSQPGRTTVSFRIPVQRLEALLA